MEISSEFLISHRGYHGNGIVENTMEAFQKSLKHHLAIELDLYLTTDSQLVVFHDSNLKRLMGVSRQIEDCSFQELSSYSFLESSSKIPLFSDVLKFVSGKVPLLIEVKRCRNYQEILKVLSTYSGEVRLQSFDFRIVSYLKHHSDFPVGILMTPKTEEQNPLYCFLVHRSLFLSLFIHPDFISYDLSGVPNRFVKHWRSSVPIYLWTIRSAKDLKKAKKYGDFFICERLSSFR